MLMFDVVMRASQSGEAINIQIEGVSFTVAMSERDDLNFCDVAWTITSASTASLGISKLVLPMGRQAYVATRLACVLPLILAYHRRVPVTLGRIDLRLEDYSDGSDVSFCSAADGALLIPDTDFIATRGYIDFRQAIGRSQAAWRDRSPVAFWRGSTTGLVWKFSDWRNLPRLRLCEIARARPDLFDVGISSVVQIEEHTSDIEAAGLVRPGVPAVGWAAYRYQIDIDGNSNAWAGYFQRLLTGSPVLKVASPFGFRQWFYDRIEPWKHYVPVAADMEDLIEKVEWLNAHEEQGAAIGEAGRAFANNMTYETEMKHAMATLDRAIRASTD